LVESPGFAALDWPNPQQALATVGLQKYCDFNLLNIATRNSAKHTFEVRVLPASLNPEPILDAADLFASILRWCIERPGVRPVPKDLAGLLVSLPLTQNARAHWGQRG
jgi:gamma-glutamyl:cysteine ligase YbdK (ATP-grasp superfamily)